MQKFRYFIILFLAAYLFSCNAVKVDNDWPPNCCGPKPVVPPGNAARFIDSVNSSHNDIAPVSRPAFTIDPYYTPDMSVSLNRETETEVIDGFDGIMPSKYFFEQISQSYNVADENFLGYITNNVESITFVDKYSGFVALSHPPAKEYAEMINFNSEGVIGGTDIFHFTYDKEFKFQNISPISDLNTPYWESHTYAASEKINGIEYTVLLWSSDRDNPFSTVKYQDGSSQTKGSTDIYYSFYSGDKWSAPKKIASPQINNPDSYEGTPTLYCLCKNSYLFFSSNRKDNSPKMLDKDITEDFDIFYAEINIDFINQTIDLRPGSTVEMFEKKTGLLSSDEAAEDYFAINTEFDDRFPYVANPLNRDTNFLYYSSNRNPEATEIYDNSDSSLKSMGGYDIYRHPLNIPCISKQTDPPSLIVEIKDAVTDSLIKAPIVHLVLNGEIVKTVSGINPVKFDSLKFNARYEVRGGSTFRSGDENACGSLITEYFAPADETVEYTLIDSSKAQYRKLIPQDSLIIYKDGFPLPSESLTIYRNGQKFDGKREISIKMDKFIEFKEIDDKSYADMEITVSYKDIFPKAAVVTKIGAYLDVQDNFDKVKQGAVNSELTKNGGVYTFSLNSGEIIHDKIYLAANVDTVMCMELALKVRTKCGYEPVRQPCIQIFALSPQTGAWENVSDSLEVKSGGLDKDNLTVSLVYGKKYKIYGGSNYIDTSACPELSFYTAAGNSEECSVTYKMPDERLSIPFAGCNVQSELTVGEKYINTRDYSSASVVSDEIILLPVKFEKPPCEYSFTEVFSDYRRRVPYFQTGFWEVNTSENLDDFFDVVWDDKSQFRKPFTATTGDREGEIWPGAKWIELHPNNSYWHVSSNPDGRKNRISEYKEAAKIVDGNLMQMQNMIADSLLKVFEYITNQENCADCENKKFVIRIEAWSDYRPVKYGWYVSPYDSNDVIQYAEFNKLKGFAPDKNTADYFKAVKVSEGDALGSRNENLSILRAYFGYQKIYEMLMKKENFKKYADQVLLPHDLIDSNSGELLPADKIASLIKQHKILIFAKGNDTYREKKDEDDPQFTNIGETVDLPKYQKLERMSTFYNLDTIRTIQVYIHQMEFDGVLQDDECCRRDKRSAFRLEDQDPYKDEKAVLEEND